MVEHMNLDWRVVMRLAVVSWLAALPTSMWAQTTARPEGTKSVVSSPAATPFTIDDALNITSYQAGDLSEDGRWLAATSAVRRDGLGMDYRHEGDPTYIRPAADMVWVIETSTGSARTVFPEKHNVRSLVWSPNAAQLAVLVYNGDVYEPVVWDRVSGKRTTLKIPAGKYVAENSDLRWTPDGRAIVVSLHTLDWRRKTREQFDRQTKGPVFVQSSEDPFLSWDDLRRKAALRSVVSIDVPGGATRELIPEGMIASYTLPKNDTLLAYSEDITKKTDYDVIFGTENRLVVRAPNAAPRTVLATLKATTVIWAEDGQRYAYGKDGKVFVSTLRDTAGRQIAGPTGPVAPRDSSADTSSTARERRARERFTPVRFNPAGDAIVLSNSQGFWIADVAAGTRDLILETNDSSTTAPRYSAATWHPDGKSVYFAYASRTKWERGFVRYDRASKQLTDLVKDSRIYSGLRFAKNGTVAVVSIADGNRPADVYAGDANLGGLKRLTTANPWLASRSLGKTGLFSYLDADGKPRYGVVYYPANYVEGERVPTVFNIYEDFFDDGFDATANVLTANGYAVVKPSVGFEIGFPGEAWVKGVTAAANKLIEMGVADSARLGVHGTSYGGYATNLLITQTHRFKAAINISGKVDLISFYTDSPRLGVRNIHAAEKSQDRIGATLWQQPQKYVEHSAIMFADRITTPLMLMTGAQDPNVPADNTREMYYALRRLGKKVVWVNYMNSGHGTPGTTVEDFTDFHKRILEWYGQYLKSSKGKGLANGA